jgi:F0F1-type ATP synthase assembly protein I
MTTDARTGRGYEYGGPAFPGAIVVGIGLGILLDDFFAWLLIGIGAGFILMGFIAAIARR